MKADGYESNPGTITVSDGMDIAGDMWVIALLKSNNRKISI